MDDRHRKTPIPVYVPIPEALIVWPQDFGTDAGWDALSPRQRRLHVAAVATAVAVLTAIVAVAGMGGVA